MIDHISLRCSDVGRSKSFYAEALAPLGYQIVMEFPDAVGLGVGGKPDFWITKGEVGTPAHIAFVADRPAVDAFHRAALTAGGGDHGAPGVRAMYHPNYYGAFVLDPDGHNIEAVCHRPPGAPRSGAGASAAKKRPAKKQPAKKQPAKKQSAKKQPAKKAVKRR